MAYGTYAPPVRSGFGGYSANPVTSGDAQPYTDPAFEGYSQYQPREGAAADTTPATGGGEGAGGGGMGGGGMGAGGWMALFQMIGDKLEGRRAAQATAAAAANDIPEDPKWMKPFLDQMGAEGVQLRDSTLGKVPTAQATAQGHNAASSRGLSGPLAASVAANAVGVAQGSYDKWRQSALMAHRQMYMDKLGQYMKAIQAYKAAKVRRGLTAREAEISRAPIGPIGGAIARMGYDSNWWGGDNNAAGIANYSAYPDPKITSY